MTTTRKAGGMTRRALLADAATLGAGLIAAAGLPEASATEAHPPVDLSGSGSVVVGDGGGAWGAAKRAAYFEPFEAETGIRVVPNPTGGAAKLRAGIKAGVPGYDVYSFSGGHLETFVGEGLLEPIDYRWFDPADKAALAPVPAHEYGVPSLFFSLVLTYDAAKFPRSSPKTWADFWDTRKYPGARTLATGAFGPGGGLFEVALLADGVPPANLYPLDLDRAFRSLDRIRPAIAKFWQGGAEPVQLVVDGQVALASAWNGRVADLQFLGPGHPPVRLLGGPQRGEEHSERDEIPRVRLQAPAAGPLRRTHHVRADQLARLRLDQALPRRPPPDEPVALETPGAAGLPVVEQRRRVRQDEPAIGDRALGAMAHRHQVTLLRKSRCGAAAAVPTGAGSHAIASRLSQAAALLPAGAVLAVGYVFPLARLLLTTFWVDGDLSLKRYLWLMDTPVFVTVVGRTFWTSAAVTCLCVVLGYPLAYTLSRLPARLSHPLLLVVTVPFFTSVLIRSYAWVAILGNNGLVNRLLLLAGIVDEPLRLVHNSVGALIGMTQVQLPLMVLPLYSVMRMIDRSLVLAAQSLGAPPARAFWHVFVPLARPGLVAGASLVFVTSLGFFVTPALLGGPGEYMIAQAIEVRVTTLADFGGATAQASVLLMIVIGMMWALRSPLGLSLRLPGEGPSLPRSTTRLRCLVTAPAAPVVPLLHCAASLRAPVRSATDKIVELVSALRTPMLGLISGTALVFLTLPLAVVVPLAFSNSPYLAFPPPGYSLRWFDGYLHDAAWLISTLFSFGIATLSAALATILGTLATFPIVRSRTTGSALFYLVGVSPLIVPHIVIAVALFFLFAPAGLVGSPMAFVLAYIVLGFPYVLVVMTSALQRFDRSLEYAAASLGAPPLRVACSITLPLLRPAVGSAYVFAFLAAFDDLVVALFLSAPGSVTLPVRMWEDIRLEISPKIAAVSVLLLGSAGLVLAAPRAARWLFSER